MYSLTIPAYSFVRSTTMDRWKESEVEKMKVGGNSRAKEFFDTQSDIYPEMTFSEKYNSRAAALYRDKVMISTAYTEYCLQRSIF